MVGAVTEIFCQLFDGRSDYAEYLSFDAQADMDASFDYLVDHWLETEPGPDCETGPYQGGYTIGSEPAGRLLCAPHITGTRMDWTYDDLLILSTLIDLEGSYADMYADWLVAGPN